MILIILGALVYALMITMIIKLVDKSSSVSRTLIVSLIAVLPTWLITSCFLSTEEMHELIRVSFKIGSVVIGIATTWNIISKEIFP